MSNDKDVGRWIQRANGLARARLNHHSGRGEAEAIMEILRRATAVLSDDEAQAYALLRSVSDRLVKLGVHEHQMPWIESTEAAHSAQR